MTGWCENLGKLADSCSVVCVVLAIACCAVGQNPRPLNGDTFETVAKSAAVARESGKVDEAIREYARSVVLHPDWEEGWWYLGTLQYDGGQYAKAIPAFEKVVTLDPTLGSAWNFLGLCEFEVQNYPQSFEHLNKGQTLGAGDDPEVARVSNFHLALLHIRRGEFEDTAAILRGSFADDPASEVMKALGLVLLRVPLVPREVDPTKDGLISAAGEAAAAERGNPEEAIKSYRTLIAKNPNLPYLHFSFGRYLASIGRVEDALAEQKAEILISPASALPQIEISALELHLGQPQKALDAARGAVRLEPDSSAAHRALAETERATGQSEQATVDVGKADSLGHDSPRREARLLQLYGRGAATPQTADAQSPTPDTQRSQAMAYYAASRYADVIVPLTAYLGNNPNDGTGWAMLGLSEFELKNYDNALLHLEHGQALGMGGSPESIALAQYKLGLLLNRAGRHEKALQILASVPNTSSLSSEINFALGMALLRIAALPEQVEAAKKKLITQAGPIAAFFEQSKYDSAFSLVEALLKKYPDAPFLHYAYGVALASLSQYDDAVRQFQLELKISSRSELPYVRLAAIALQRRRPEDALPPAARAVELAPTSAEAHYLFGRAYLETGRNDKALRELQTSEKLAPGRPEIHFNLAKAYAKAKLPAEENRERQIFESLNESAQQARSVQGNQIYGGSNQPQDFSTAK